ncbi:MAG: lytic transglycosylase domain-containing protein [Bacteriovoracia bacterium]
MSIRLWMVLKTLFRNLILISATFLALTPALTPSVLFPGVFAKELEIVPSPTADVLSNMALEVDPKLQKRIDFWIRIYTEFSTSEGVIHDAKYPEIVFEKLDFKIEYSDFKITQRARQRTIDKRLKNVKDFYFNLLMSIHKKIKKEEPLNVAEQRIFDLYKDVDEPNKFYQAARAKRLRFQLGQKDRFLHGLFYSGRYLPLMEKIFRERGVPVEISRLPFVESSFNLKARSKVGASGIWQFIRSTGKLYLKINDTLDERNDPIRATEAAAALLQHNLESLNNWPLAITAYNHGRKGLMRAVRKVGSDKLVDIIERYRSRSFGFASSNFFCELMAAVHVEKNAEKYFGSVERDEPIEFEEFILPNFISIFDISTYTKIPLDTLVDLNPALSDTVLKGKRLVPSGYALRIPPSMKDDFIARYAEIPAHKKYSQQKTVVVTARRR